MIEPVAYIVITLFAIGMAASFFGADPRSPTSRALSLFWCLLGLMFLTNILGNEISPQPSMRLAAIRFFSTGETLILVTGLEWGRRVLRTLTLDAERRSGAERWLRAAQGVALLYGALGIAFTDLQSTCWKGIPWRAELLARPGFYLFAAPFFTAILLPVVPVLRSRGGELDPAERVRVFALLLTVPFWIAGMVLPFRWKPIAFALGEVTFFFGAIRYHVLQGQRGQFLARFVSPELARVVRERGLSSSMQRNRVELSVVACDLRGFTAFAETGAPEEVMKLLEEYYAAVGEIVTEHGGSIKDFAGDGILALVGAPIPLPDHARRAVEMALKIRDRGEQVLERWRALGLDLGLGVGVASGFATVGTIGGTGRLEYGAVGPVVNLASRLTSRAEAGRVLADPRTAGVVGSDEGFRFEKLETAELKGFARPVTIYAVERGDRAEIPHTVAQASEL